MTTATITGLRRRLRQPAIIGKYVTLRAVSGSTRFKIMVMLHTHRQGLTITEMAEVLQNSLSRVSHQIRILRQRQIIISTRRHRQVTYRLRDGSRLDWYLRSK